MKWIKTRNFCLLICYLQVLLVSIFELNSYPSVLLSGLWEGHKEMERKLMHIRLWWDVLYVLLCMSLNRLDRRPQLAAWRLEMVVSLSTVGWSSIIKFFAKKLKTKMDLRDSQQTLIFSGSFCFCCVFLFVCFSFNYCWALH